VTCVVVAAVLVGGCGSDRKKVDDANKAAGSWAATVKAVTEQWAQSRVSLRFTRTTLNTATNDLDRQAQSIRSIDAGAAARIDRLRSAIDPIRDAVALNEPDHARDAAKTITSIIEAEPIAASARPQ